MLPLRLTWALSLKRASKLSFFSAKRRARLARSAHKRFDRLIIRLGDLIDVKTDTPHPTEVYRGTPLSSQRSVPDYKILIVCMHAPTINHAGGLRILDIVKMIKSNVPNSYVEIFTPANKNLYGPIDKAIHIADKVTIANDYNFSLPEYLRQNPKSDPCFDVIDFQFPQPIDVVESYRKIGRKLLFTPMESHIRNELIKPNATEDTKIKLKSEDALQEVVIIDRVDQTVCVSEMDRAAIAPYVEGNVVAIETGISDIEFSDDIAAKTAPSASSICYVAYFGSQTNRDALKWYLDEVHPLVVSQIPEYELSIIGRGDISDLLDPMPQGVKYVGEVDRIGPYIKSAAIGIAPALSGSGFRGKINQYAYLGLPTVASPLAAKGLAYVHGQSIFVAEKPQDFAHYIIELIQNPSVQEQVAAQASEVTRNNYTWANKWPAIADAYGLPKQVEQFSGPTVHAVIPSYQHARFIEERIRSVFSQEYPHIRVTVIDDHSTDESNTIIQKLHQEFDFDYIRKDQNSGTPFSAWEYAAQNTKEDLIWICESDDVADTMFVATMTKLLMSRSTAKIAYCGSWLIDDDGLRFGSTKNYHLDHFHSKRWENPLFSDGENELKKFLRFGMVVPNMSSALIDRDVFKKAFTPNIKDYRLAGDWLFVGQVMRYGDIVFTPKLLNQFRNHQQTSRKITKNVRRIAEHISVRLMLSDLANANECELLDAVKYDILELRNAPELVDPVLVELQQINPSNERTFRMLLDGHLTKNKMSKDLEDALAVSAL